MPYDQTILGPHVVFRCAVQHLHHATYSAMPAIVFPFLLHYKLEYEEILIWW